jgi:hypothetical protein
MLFSQPSPPSALSWAEACNFPEQTRQLRYLRVIVVDELLQTGGVLFGNVRLIQKTIEFIEALNAISLGAGHPLACLADVVAMAASAELLIRA